VTVPAAILRLLASDQVVDLVSGEPESPDSQCAALLAFLTSICDVRALVEIGSADGVTAGALVAGQRTRGIVTSIESDRAAHDAALARLAGPISDGRVRLMHGATAEVLSRLTDGGYGLALMQQDPAQYDAILDQVIRLVAPGGIIIARRVLAPEQADAIAPFLQRIAEISAHATIVDIDGGLLLATLAN
jgi:predicted O-methyltransferase YrrM